MSAEADIPESRTVHSSALETYETASPSPRFRGAEQSGPDNDVWGAGDPVKLGL
ncbi:hypothetical protein ACFVWY_26735 [Streptomyces sp. NPDC058195]|uniref:hypothetical protein n=1 Tax=Streptomyces sp. NPDC058195 TaxID=3346375 RepID=UPI0036E563B0